MRKLLTILFLIPFLVKAQDPDIFNLDTVTHSSASEYFSELIYNHQIYNNLNVASPVSYPGQAVYMAEGWAGAHDAGGIDYIGKLSNGAMYGHGYFVGSIFGTSGTMNEITTDSAGNTLSPIVQISYGLAWGTELWNVAIVMTNGGVDVAGTLTGGVRGNGTAGSSSQTSFVPVQFYKYAFITKAQMGVAPMVLDTVNGGTVWTWGGNNGGGGGGSLSMIGRGNSPTRSFMTPDTVAIPSGLGRPVDIAAWGWFGFILTSKHDVLFIGEQAQYAGQGSAVNTPVNVTNYLYTYIKTPSGAADSIVKMAVNSSGTYFICKDSTLWFAGSTVCGAGGNGAMAIWPLYTSNPAPYGGTVLGPYAYDGGFGEIMQPPKQLAPGTHNWVGIYTNACYTFFANFTRADGRHYAVARDKANPFWLPTIGAAYYDGIIESDLPDSWDEPYLVQIAGNGVSSQPYSTTYQVTSPRCLLAPSSDTCNSYTIPAHTPPTASLTGFYSNGVIYLNGTGSTPGPHVTHMYDFTLTQANPGSDPAVLDMGIQLAGANQSSILDTISTAAGQTIPAGTYNFTLRNRNITWDSAFATLAITVGSGVQTRFYVATLGSGTSCSLSTPCSGSYMQSQTTSLVPGDTVSFNSGDVFPYDYVFSVSGSSGSRIIINSYGTGPEPVIGGLTTLSGWTNSGNLWSTSWAGPTPTILVINAALAGMSRTPNQTSGYSTFIPSASTTTDINMTSTSLFYPGAHIRVRSSGFTIDSSIVSSLTATDLTITPAVSYNNVGANGIALWQNLPDSVTEWRDTSGTIQTYALSTPVNYQVPTVGTPLTLSGSYITVTGIHVSGSDSTNVLITGSNDNLKSDSLDYGMDAIQINSSSNDSINGCYIAHFGDNAILKQNTSNYKNVFINNIVNDIGMIPGMGTSGNLYQTYCGVVIGDSASVVKFNRFTNIGYIPIATYGSGFVADSNFIYSFMHTKSDGGGIYSWVASSTHFPTAREIKGNVIANAGFDPYVLNGTTLNISSLAAGIYLDNYTRNVNVLYNFIDSINGPGIFDHGDSNSITYNQVYGSQYSDLLLAEVGPVIKGLTVKYNVFTSGTPLIPAVRASTVNNDLSTFGAIDYNIIAGSPGTVSPYWTYSTGASDPGTFRTPAGWTTNVGYDVHSTYQTGRIFAYYNGTSSPISQSLWTSFTDVSSNFYPIGNTTIAPYNGLILFIYRPGYFTRKRFFAHYFN